MRAIRARVRDPDGRSEVGGHRVNHAAGSVVLGDRPELAGAPPEGEITPEAFANTPWHHAYLKAAPHPEQWAALLRKVQQLDMSGWKPAEIKATKPPVLFMIGDSDVARPEHGVEMFRLFGGGVTGDVVGLPRARLAILPGTTHVTIVHHPALASLITPFLDAR